MLTGDSKWGAFYGCEAFILPSHQENFGIAVVEALACGKPVLISNKINIYKEIEKEGAGFINEDNLNGTISNLNKWFNLTDEAKIKMSYKAYSVYENNFKIEISANKLIDSVSKIPKH
jgi:glycosyltransferase involved in cell wall biosynthesis